MTKFDLTLSSLCGLCVNSPTFAPPSDNIPAGCSTDCGKHFFYASYITRWFTSGFKKIIMPPKTSAKSKEKKAKDKNLKKKDNVLELGKVPLKKSNDNQKWTFDKASIHLKNNWTNSRSHVSFLGIQRIRDFYNKTLSVKDIRQILSTIDSYSLMKQTPNSQIKKGNTFYSTAPHDCWQSDSINISELSQFNFGIKYLFCTVDTFTKFCWIQPMTNTRAESGIEALIKTFVQAGKIPFNLGADCGSELLASKKVLNFLRSNGIKAIKYTGISKAAVVER